MTNPDANQHITVEKRGAAEVLAAISTGLIAANQAGELKDRWNRRRTSQRGGGG
jgi:hypothetical protein